MNNKKLTGGDKVPKWEGVGMIVISDTWNKTVSQILQFNSSC